MEKKVPERKVTLREEDIFYVYDKRINKCIKEGCEGTVKYGLVLKVSVSENESINCFECNKCHMKYTPYPNYVRLTNTDMMHFYNKEEIDARDKKRAEDAIKQAARERKKLSQRSYGDKNQFGKRPYSKKPYGKKSYENRPYSQGGYERRSYDKTADDRRPYDKPYASNSSGKKIYVSRPYNGQSYDRKPYDRTDSAKRSYGSNGYDRRSYEQSGFNRKPYEQSSFDKRPYDNYGKRSYNQGGYEQRNYDRKPYDRKTYSNSSSYDASRNFGYDKKYASDRNYDRNYNQNKHYERPSGNRPYKSFQRQPQNTANESNDNAE